MANNDKHKSEAGQVIAEYVEAKLKEGYLLNMMQGFEVAMSMMDKYVKSHTYKETKAFIEQNLKKKDLIKNIVMGNKESEENENE